MNSSTTLISIPLAPSTDSLESCEAIEERNLDFVLPALRWEDNRETVEQRELSLWDVLAHQEIVRLMVKGMSAQQALGKVWGKP